MKKNNLKIYNKFINEKYKIVPLNKRNADSGKTKYLPPYFEEWNNTTYSFNKNLTQNITVYSSMINKIIKSYFNLLYLNYKYSIPQKKRLFLKDIYSSDIKIKFTNSKAIITLYTLNLRKHLFTKYLNYFYYYSMEKEWEEISSERKNRIGYEPYSLIKILKNKFLKFIGIETIYFKQEKLFLSSNSHLINLNNFLKIKEILNLKFKIFDKGLKSYNLFRKIHLIKEIKHIYHRYLIILYKYNYLYFFNNLKFYYKNNSFIHKLRAKISILLNRKVELNIINLKNITHNPNIFTKALTIKLRKRKFNIIKSLITVINKGSILTKNYLHTESLLKNRNLDLLENKFKDFSLISILNKNNLNKFLKDNFPFIKFSNTSINEDFITLYNTIFNLIKYKNMGGIRLEVKGRLTKRYRADRAIYKLHWKGGLKNIDSSLKRLSSVLYRGHLKSNVMYSISKSKRRIGSFAVKGWISGK